jgi:hypothetical protein
MKLKIIDASYHRNGVAGEPFWAILFDDAENGRMIASLFVDNDAYCAVYNVDKLAQGDIRFTRNSWRGDNYASELRPLLREYFKKEAA